MIVDLHNHCEFSKNTNLKLEDYINKAYQLNISFAITEHNCLYPNIESNDQIKIFSGIEILNNFGDFLVFGAPEDCVNIRQDIFALINYVHKHNGIIIAAHPYSGYGICNVVENELADRIIKELDAIEVYNGLATREVWEKAEILAKKYNKPRIGGSDAHEQNQLFTVATKFINNIDNLNDIIKEIKLNRCEPVILSKF